MSSRPDGFFLLFSLALFFIFAPTSKCSGFYGGLEVDLGYDSNPGLLSEPEGSAFLGAVGDLSQGFSLPGKNLLNFDAQITFKTFFDSNSESLVQGGMELRHLGESGRFQPSVFFTAYNFRSDVLSNDERNGVIWGLGIDYYHGPKFGISLGYSLNWMDYLNPATIESGRGIGTMSMHSGGIDYMSGPGTRGSQEVEIASKGVSLLNARNNKHSIANQEGPFGHMMGAGSGHHQGNHMDMLTTIWPKRNDRLETVDLSIHRDIADLFLVSVLGIRQRLFSSIKSESFKRYGLGMRITAPVPLNCDLSSTFMWYRSRFRSTDLIGDRTDYSRTFTLSIEKPFKRFGFSINYEYFKNSSSISLEAYERHKIYFGIGFYF